MRRPLNTETSTMASYSCQKSEKSRSPCWEVDALAISTHWGYRRIGDIDAFLRNRRYFDLDFTFGTNIACGRGKMRKSTQSREVVVRKHKIDAKMGNRGILASIFLRFFTSILLARIWRHRLHTWKILATHKGFLSLQQNLLSLCKGGQMYLMLKQVLT